MSRASLITLIHVAKNDLRLDDETYRALLMRITGETSCRNLRVNQLESVIKALEDNGFSRKKTSKRRPKVALPESDKVRVIWRNMAHDGFLANASEVALDHFIQRMTSRKNGGEGVATLAWLRGDDLVSVLEGLKKWHIREMKMAMNLHHVSMPVNPRTGSESRDYDTICGAYLTAAKRWSK
ncbi:TPA: gp16 family protein [Enterobacter roggenkampii]|uniref:gp16 family protein n=1 Tax=Enterobacteriaceae TaxID=543 RepID=UPI00193DD52A|nr:regulatory protein GemA [Lelliottia sp. RWM.1]MBM3072363.1 DUF1018 domain-containing protein [Lelliottia sp. RWM.1]